MVYLKEFAEAPIPQSEALPGQIANSAGGFSYQVDDMTRLRRFLVLGSEGGSYYATQRKLTKDNAEAVLRCIKNDGIATVQEIAEISKSGRAPKNDPALFSLALAASNGDDDTRAEALRMMPEIARTGSHLLQFTGYVDSMRGWGPALRKSVSNWYTSKTVEQCAYQTVKYRSRYDWSHRDLLCKAHPEDAEKNGKYNELFNWITQGKLPSDASDLHLVHAYEQAKTADVKTLTQLIRDNKMSWEMVPPEMMDKKEVWEALAEDMPMTALIRNLATLTRNDVIAPMNAGWVCDKIRQIGNGRVKIHPLGVLIALLTYKAGKGARGKGTWTPVQPVVDALDDAFEKAFVDAPQTNQRFYLGIDVSGSMDWSTIAGVPGLTPRMGAAAMAMCIARREPNYHLAAFSAGSQGHWRNSEMNKFNVSARDSISSVVSKTNRLSAGGTDCALPMLDALNKRMPVDCFVVLTDSETWAGKIHPAEALRKYRKEMQIPAKLVVVGMVANEVSIADPNDAGMMDVVGFDAAVPEIIADFVTN